MVLACFARCSAIKKKLFKKRLFAKHADQRLFAKRRFAKRLFAKLEKTMDFLQLDADSDSDAFIMLHMMSSAMEKQREKWHHDLINWEQHLQKLRHTNGFQK